MRAIESVTARQRCGSLGALVVVAPSRYETRSLRVSGPTLLQTTEDAIRSMSQLRPQVAYGSLGATRGAEVGRTAS